MVRVSTEVVLETGKGNGSDMNENSAGRVTVSTVVSEYAVAHAEYTSGTDWLNRKDRTVAPLDESVLESACCRYPRRNYRWWGC